MPLCMWWYWKEKFLCIVGVTGRITCLYVGGVTGRIKCLYVGSVTGRQKFPCVGGVTGRKNVSVSVVSLPMCKNAQNFSENS